jgi:TPR repeat protein
MYHQGRGVKQGKAEAAKMYRMGADQRPADAQ